MAYRNVTINALPEAVKGLTRDAHKRVVEAIRISCKTDAELFIQQQIDATNPVPVDRGTYRRNWKVSNIPGGAMIRNQTPYSAVIEGGRRQGARMPPPDVIGEWARRKGLLKGTPKASMASAQRAIGFVISRAIAKRGIPAKNVLELAMARFKPVLMAAVQKALKGGTP